MNKKLLRERNMLFIWRWRNIFVLMFVITLTALLSCSQQQSSEEYKRNHPSAKQVNVFSFDISSDNKKLLFDYGSPYWSKIATYDISTGKVQPLEVDKINKMILGALFSPDGKKICFLVGKEKDSPLNFYIMNADGSNIRQITYGLQVSGGSFSPDGEIIAFLARNKKDEPNNIYIMNTDGSNLRRITIDQHTKGFPQFSPDGKKIIYQRSQMKRQRAYPLHGEMDTAWDVYEYNFKTGTERRLTNYNYYKASLISYMADGKRFLFNAEGPVNLTGKGPKDFKEYEKMYQKNFIFIMDGVNNELKPAFTNGCNSIARDKATDDSILFLSEINKNNHEKITRELYLYKKGKTIQLTKLYSEILTGIISKDGSTILFKERKNNKSLFWLIKSDGTGLREINLPLNELK